MQADKDQSAADAKREEAKVRRLSDEIVALWATGKREDAEEKFEAALKQYPDSELLKSLHLMAFRILSRANLPNEADQHLEIFVNNAIGLAAKDPAAVEELTFKLGALAQLLAQQDGPDAAVALLDAFANRATKMDGANAELKSSILTEKIILLGKSGKAEDGRALVAEHIAAAKLAIDTDPTSLKAFYQMSSALKNREVLETFLKGGDREAAWTELSDFLDGQARAHPDNKAITMRFLNEHSIRAGYLIQTSPDAAEVVLKRIADFRVKEGANVKVPEFIDRELTQIKKRIADSRGRE
ncbi:MAG: hypothetical protein WD851_05710 [Pirellulales bacterium]